MRRLAGIALAAVLLPLPGAATDLTFDFTGAADYDTNVYRRRDGGDAGTRKKPEDDFLFRLRPGVRIHEDRGQDLNYSLRYRLPVEISTGDNDLNEIDHIADAQASYRLAERLQVFASDEFRSLRSTLVNTESSGELQTARDRIQLNEAVLGARYSFSPRLTGSMVATHRSWRTTRNDRQDNDVASLTLDGIYQLNSRHQAGLGATYRFQTLQESTQAASSDAHSLNLFVQWRWQLDETTGIETSVGPSIIWIRQDRFKFAVFRNLGIPCLTTPPPPPNGTQTCIGRDTDTSVNIFAQLGIIKRWTPTLSTGANYVRSQGTASGIGGTVISDAVAATLDWEFRERWEVALRGDYVLRESVSDVNAVPGRGSRLDNERWGGSARLAHRLARKTRIFSEVRYNNQTSNSNLGSGSDFENWIFTIGFNHVFEPIKLF